MHLYHNADPVPIGVCTGPGASCYYGGYALETRCHLGKSIVYDTVNELKWAVDIRTHTITTVIEQVLSKEDLTVPEPKPEDDCVVRRLLDIMTPVMLHYASIRLTPHLLFGIPRNAILGSTATSRIPRPKEETIRLLVPDLFLVHSNFASRRDYSPILFSYSYAGILNFNSNHPA
jgi:hypothetical protein